MYSKNCNSALMRAVVRRNFNEIAKCDFLFVFITYFKNSKAYKN